MACVERVNHIIFRAIACIKIVRSHGVCFQTYTKKLCFEAAFHVWKLFRKNVIEAFFQNFAVAITLYGIILASVMNPDIHNTGVVLILTHGIGYAATAFGMFNPEVANSLVGIRKCEVTALGM